MVILKLEDQPPLVQAIIAGDVENVKTLLENKADVNCLDIEKRSPLHAAAFIGYPNITELLLQHGARVNCKDSKWLTPLHRACCTDSAETVSVLLAYQADVTVRDRQWQTPLHIAAANNAYKCVTQLLKVVPNVNVTDRAGRTALHHAAMNGHNDIVSLLIWKGCIINACDKKDCRPIHLAAYMGHIDTLVLLITQGADINAKDRNQYTALHVAAASGMANACRLLLNRGSFTECRNAYGNTPLHIACLNGHLQVCQELIAFNADPEATNYRGQTPLHIAAASTHGVDCLNYLLELKVNLNKQSLDGRTPLHMTAIHGRFTRSKTLIDKGAIVDAVDKNGCTALHIAAQYGHDLLAHTLLSHGADPSRKGYEGRTPLHMCCLSGFVECCRKFLQARVDINTQDDTGKTATHCAAYKGSVDCLDLLVSNGANFHLVDIKGRTPLHYAAVQGHYPCVFTLVGLGSSVNLKDEEGCTALHLASAYDLEGKCVQYLIEHKADPKMKDNSGFTPIHYAVAGNNIKALAYLLSAVGNNHLFHGGDMALTTPLHLAAASGNVEILNMILPYFHDTNVRTEHGSTSLLLAAREGHIHCVQTLLRFGSKVAICDNVYNMNPVHYSAKNGHMHCLAMLLDNTEDRTVVNTLDSLQRTPLMLAVSGGHTDCALVLLKSGADPNIVDAEKRSALFRAVVNSQNNAVQLLISNRADLKLADINGKTALHLAAACGNLSCLKTVAGSSDNDVLTSLDNQECSSLHWASYNGHADCVDFLLNSKMFETLKGNPFSPLHCAAYSGSKKCLELLCNYYGESSVLLRDARNRTPLHIVALHGHIECAKYLLEKGAEINCQDAEGRTPLIAAAQNGQTQVIDVFLSHKADITMYDNNGNTALHLACLKKHSDAALLLLEDVNDPNVVNMINNDRKTPLHLSARNGLVGVTRQLIDKGASVLMVDSNGMTPALCCAPDNNVAQCLAVILSSYPKQQQQRQNTNTENSVGDKADIFPDPRPSEDSYLIRHVIEVKRALTKTREVASQTKMSLLQNPEYFHCQLLQAEARLESRTSSLLLPHSHASSNTTNGGAKRPKNRSSAPPKRNEPDEKKKAPKWRLSNDVEKTTTNEERRDVQLTTMVNSLHRSRSHMSVNNNKGAANRTMRHSSKKQTGVVVPPVAAFGKPEHLKQLLTDLNLGENKPDSFYEKLSERFVRRGASGSTEIDRRLQNLLLKHLADKWARDTNDNFENKYVNRRTSDATLDKIIRLRSRIAALKTTTTTTSASVDQLELFGKVRDRFGINASEVSLRRRSDGESSSQDQLKEYNVEEERNSEEEEEDFSTLVIKYHPLADEPSPSSGDVAIVGGKQTESKLVELSEEIIKDSPSVNNNSEEDDEEPLLNIFDLVTDASKNEKDTVVVSKKFLAMLIKPSRESSSILEENASVSSRDSLEDMGMMPHHGGSSYLKVLESFSTDEVLRVDDVVHKMEAQHSRKRESPRLPLKGAKPGAIAKLEPTPSPCDENAYRSTIKRSLSEIKDADCLKSLADYVQLLVKACTTAYRWFPPNFSPPNKTNLELTQSDISHLEIRSTTLVDDRNFEEEEQPQKLDKSGTLDPSSIMSSASTLGDSFVTALETAGSSYNQNTMSFASSYESCKEQDDGFESAHNINCFNSKIDEKLDPHKSEITNKDDDVINEEEEEEEKRQQERKQQEVKEIIEDLINFPLNLELNDLNCNQEVKSPENNDNSNSSSPKPPKIPSMENDSESSSGTLSSPSNPIEQRESSVMKIRRGGPSKQQNRQRINAKNSESRIFSKKLQRLRAKRVLNRKKHKGKATKRELRKRWPKNTRNKKEEIEREKKFREYLLKQARDINKEDLENAGTSKGESSKETDRNIPKDIPEILKKPKQKSNCVIS